MKINYILLLLTITLLSCHPGKKAVQQTASSPMNAPSFMPGPQAIVYKTTDDYYYHVPVLINEAHTEILSYPAPQDVYIGNTPAYPTRLNNGYLLDNRGIGRNVAFLTYTYEEYHQLDKTPSMNELMEHILNKYPLAEAWNCGLRSQYEDEVNELNERIKSGFYGCKPILTPIDTKTIILRGGMR